MLSHYPILGRGGCDNRMWAIRKKSRFRFFRAAAFGAGSAISACTFGQTVASWVNPVSGSWIDPTQWSTNPAYPNNNVPPGATYDAIINAAGSYTVTPENNIALSNLTLKA